MRRKVKVTHVVPGHQAPADTDYWWDMEHDRRFYTFKDVYPAGTKRKTPHESAEQRVCTPCTTSKCHATMLLSANVYKAMLSGRMSWT